MAQSHKYKSMIKTEHMQINKLSIKYIIEHSLKLSSASLISYAIVFFVNIAIAKKLGPELFGMAGFILLFLQYAGVVRLGFIYAGYREWISERHKGNEMHAIKIQNVSITNEVLFSFIPVVFLFASGFYFLENFYRIGFWMSSVLLLLLTVDRVFGSVHLSFERFNLSSRNRFLVSAVGPILSLILISYVGLYALLLSPIIVTSVSIVLWLVFSPPVHYKPVWDIEFTRKLILIGLPMSLVSFTFTILRVADRTVVAFLLSPEELGYFNFASAIILAIAMLVNDFSTVLTPIIWGEVSRNGFSQATASNIKRVTLNTLMAAGFIINLIQAALCILLIKFVPNYAKSFPLLDILIFNLIPFQLLVIPDIILQSQNVQRQWTVLKLYAFGVLLILGSGYLSIKLGFGIYGVVYTAVLSQLIIAFSGNYFIDRYIFQTGSERIYYYCQIAAIIMLTVLVYKIFQTAFFTVGMQNVNISKLVLRVVFVIFIWGFFVFSDKLFQNSSCVRVKSSIG